MPALSLLFPAIKILLINHLHFSKTVATQRAASAKPASIEIRMLLHYRPSPPPPGQRQHATLGLEIAWTQPIAQGDT